MKFLMAMLIVSSFARSALAADLAEWRVVMEHSVEVPDGDSYSSDVLLQITDAPLLKVEMRDDRGARCNTQTIALDVSHTTTQRYYTRYYPDADGVFTLESPNVVYVKFHNRQDRWRTAYCRRVLFAKAAGGDGGGEFSIAGVARYGGGFVQRMNVPVETRDKVVKVKVAVPSFCNGAEVLELGTITEGVYEPASDRGGDVFSINRGAGSRISSVQLSINGPRQASCDIPVWIAVE